MKVTLQDDWRNVATIEVDAAVPDVERLLDGVCGHSRLVPNEHAPPGAIRYDVLVDFAIGARQAAHAACAALTGLQRVAEGGGLHGYRIVNGRHWLELADVLG